MTLPYEDTRRLAIPTTIVQLAVAYVGLSAVIPQYVVVERGPLSLGLVVAGGLAVLGWRNFPRMTAVRTYLVWGGLLAFWALLSSVAAWNSTSASAAAIYATWLVVLLPGLASLLADVRFRDAFLLGWAGGVGYYVTTAMFRIATGREVFDAGTRGNVSSLLGENRNAVNILVVVILPFILVGEGGRLLRLARWPLAVMIGVWVLNSGGRAGTLGLAMVLLVLALVQPGTSRRLQQILVVGVIGVVGFTVIQDTGGQVAESTNRILGLIRGERTNADDARELLLRKAWHLAFEHPAFGVGFGRFEETYHPVIEEAETVRTKEIAESFQEHNTFAAVVSETGFPGLAFFLATAVALFLGGVGHLRSRASRAAVASLAGLFVTIFFQSVNGPRLFLPMVLLLATVAAQYLEPDVTPVPVASEVSG